MMLPFEITPAFSSPAQYGEELRVKWSPWQVIPSSEPSGRPGTLVVVVARSTLVSVRGEELGGHVQVGPPLAQGTCPGAGFPAVGPVGPCTLALTPLGVSSVPLGTLVLLVLEKKLFRKQTEGNSQAGVSFPWSLCSFWTTFALALEKTLVISRKV